jgi:hypothetical protein
MTRALILALACCVAGAAGAQTAGTGTDSGAIQMQPLNALKPQGNVVPLTPVPQQDQTQPPAPATPAPATVPGGTTTTTTTDQVAQAPGAVVRWLDKISGETVDLTLKRGESQTQGRITVTLGDCRYPISDPASNAYAYLTIHDSLVADPIFEGWMIASSPALNPLDSARYDVWVLHCTMS